VENVQRVADNELRSFVELIQDPTRQGPAQTPVRSVERLENVRVVEMDDEMQPGPVSAPRQSSRRTRREDSFDSFVPRLPSPYYRPIQAGESAVTEAVRIWSDEVRDSRGRVVPIGFVRAREIRDGNVVTRVCMHLQRVVGSLSDESLSDESYNELPSLNEWRRLMAALAAQDGVPEGRRGELDMDAYALELEYTNRMIVEFDDIFAKFMKFLVMDYESKHKYTNPVFVFAFVECAFAPAMTQTIELAMRKLRHERLVFLVSE
jgi:hypothetical protein